MPYEVIRAKDIGIPMFRAKPFGLGDVIPDEAFEVAPNKNLKRSLLNLKWIKPAEPGALQIDGSADEVWPRHVGGPWFLTPDGVKHRGKQKALRHMENA